MDEPLACAHTVIDYVNTTTTWPQNVASVADGLRNYVATSVDKVEPSKLSPYTRSLYHELMDACRSIPRAEATGSRPVTDFIDTILSTVVLLRFFAAHPKRHCKLVQTAASLLKILGVYCSENASTIMDAPFLLPRSLPADYLQGNNFEGSTILLVCASQGGKKSSEAKTSSTSTCQVDDDNQPHSVHIDSRIPTEEAANDRCASGARNEDPIFEGSEQAKEVVTKNSDPVFDLPLDAHILPGRGLRTNCLLPALGVADERNINSLVASMAYQRYVWGITLPAVGLCLYTTSKSVFARIVIGSIEGDPEEYHMPPLRLSTSDSPYTHDPSKGVFDMTDPLDALILSQYILQLGTHVDTVHRFRVPNGCQGFTWRADQTDLRPENVATCCIRPGTTSGEWEDAVASWRQQTPTVNSGDLVVPQPQSSTDQKSSGRSPISSAMPSNRSPSLISQHSEPPLPSPQFLQVPPDSQSSRTQSSNGTSNSKASALAKHLVEFDVWLARRTIVVAAVSHFLSSREQPKSALQERIEKKIPIYQSFTEPPEWTQSWPKNMHIPKPCDAPMLPIRDDFVAQKAQDDLTRPKHDLNSQAHASLLKQRIESDRVGFQVVMDRFTILLFAVELARLANHVGSNEAGTRQPWDIIFYIACCNMAPSESPHTVLSGDVWPERYLNLHPTATPDPAAIRSFVEIQKDIALKQTVMTVYDRARKILDDVQEALALTPTEPQRAIMDVIVSSPIALDPVEPVRRHKTTYKLLHSIIGFFKRTETSGKVSSAGKRSPSPAPSNHDGVGRVWFISTLGGEYKRNATASSMAQAKNQATIYLVTMLKYLDSYGFPDVPVFMVAGFANVGTILMAWKDQESGFTIVFREQTKLYDLSKPIEAFFFAMALHRIYHRQNAFIKSMGSDDRKALYEKLCNMPTAVDPELGG